MDQNPKAMPVPSTSSTFLALAGFEGATHYVEEICW